MPAALTAAIDSAAASRLGVHRAGDRARRDRQAAAASDVTVSPVDQRRRRAAARVPAHRPAAQDRARGAAARAAAGEPRADPQSRARDQESARRHPRRRAAPRARARPPAAQRVHAGHHRRGRPAAVAGQPAAHAAPAAELPAHERARDARAGEGRRAGRVSRDPDRRGLRHVAARDRGGSGAAHAGGAQHRAQRGAGAERHDERAARSASPRASRAT